MLGGLCEDYGVKNLVEAFKLIDNRKLELHLYGNGELVDYIKKQKDKRIIYHGIKDNIIVREEESVAKLLINPRFTNSEYTKYSFPSKIMEYMASGTPVLTTKLSGIPDEYGKYVYFFEDESIVGMKEKMIEILSKSDNELYMKGRSARNFIIKNKNIMVQGKRIISLIKNKYEK